MMMLQCSTTKALQAGSTAYIVYLTSGLLALKKKVVKSTQHPTKISMRMLSLFFSELEFRDYQHTAILLATGDRHKHVVSWHEMHTVHKVKLQKEGIFSSSIYLPETFYQ